MEAGDEVDVQEREAQRQLLTLLLPLVRVAAVVEGAGREGGVEGQAR